MRGKLSADRLARGLGSALLAFGTLAWIADRSGPARVEVVVHVAVPDVEVRVGDCDFRVEGRRLATLVCELPPGRHELLTRRGPLILQAQPFEVRRGENVVLTSWDARTPSALLVTRNSPAPEPHGPAHLPALNLLPCPLPFALNPPAMPTPNPPYTPEAAQTACNL